MPMPLQTPVKVFRELDLLYIIISYNIILLGCILPVPLLCSPGATIRDLTLSSLGLFKACRVAIVSLLRVTSYSHNIISYYAQIFTESEKEYQSGAKVSR